MHGTMTAMLNRKGRKRKSGKREASGRAQRQPIDYRALVSGQPHRKWLPESFRGHERAENVLGCLNLLWRIQEAKNANAEPLAKHEPNPGINEEQYEAGRRFSVIVGNFRQVIGAPRGSIGSGRGYTCVPSLCANDAENCLCESRTAKYRDATRILQGAGQKSYNITYQVAISDMRPNAEQLEDLKAGLYALARGFGLTGKRG